MYLAIVFWFLANLLLSFSVWAQPVQKQFADWQVTCNNQNFCHARNNTAHHGLIMTLHYGSNGAEKLSIALTQITPSQPITSCLLLDKQQFTLPPGQWQVLPSKLMTRDSATINSFLQQIAQAHTISLSQSRGIISLEGLQQVMEFMHQQTSQSRSVQVHSQPGAITAAEHLLNNMTAPAKNPPANAAAPIPLTRQERQELLEFVNWRINYHQCSLPPARRQISLNVLDNNTALVLLSCEGGAYNVVDLAWLVSRDLPYTFYPLRLQLPFSLPEIKPEIELMNASFNEQTAELTTLAKDRAPCDCGITTRWHYNDGKFSLLHYARQPVCDGWYQRAEQWPALWVMD